jgi:hypothetical protein
MIAPDRTFNCYYSTYGVDGPAEEGLVAFGNISKNEPVRFILRNGTSKEVVIDTGYIGNLKYNYLGTNREEFKSSLTGKKDPYINSNYPISYNANDPKHKKIAPDGYPIVYAENNFEEYFYKNDKNTKIAYVDVFDPMCTYNWFFIVSCPCLIDCFEPDAPPPPSPPSGSVPGQSKTPTPTKTPPPTRTPTNTTGLTPTPTRSKNDCFDCGPQLYAGTQIYPQRFCFNIGDSVNTNVVLNIDTVRYPDRYIVTFDGSVRVDTGYIGLDSYGYVGDLRNEFNKSLIGRKDPYSDNLYPNNNIYEDTTLPNVYITLKK